MKQLVFLFALFVARVAAQDQTFVGQIGTTQSGELSIIQSTGKPMTAILRLAKETVVLGGTVFADGQFIFAEREAAARPRMLSGRVADGTLSAEYCTPTKSTWANAPIYEAIAVSMFEQKGYSKKMERTVLNAKESYTCILYYDPPKSGDMDVKLMMFGRSFGVSVNSKIEGIAVAVEGGVYKLIDGACRYTIKIGSNKGTIESPEGCGDFSGEYK